jgi:hypothetical protein
LPAHQFILKIASDVFEAMFRFDAKKERAHDGKKIFLKANTNYVICSSF